MDENLDLLNLKEDKSIVKNLEAGCISPPTQKPS